MPLPLIFEKRIAPYEPVIQNASSRYGIPIDLLKGIIYQESRGNAKAVSPKGARGLMQLMPDTAKSLGVDDPSDPAQSIEGGAKYFKQQLDKFGDVTLALAAYNAGPGNVNKHKGVPPFEETRNYVKNILGKFTGKEVELPGKPEIRFSQTPEKQALLPSQKENVFFPGLGQERRDLTSINAALKRSLGEEPDFGQVISRAASQARQDEAAGVPPPIGAPGFSVFESQPTLTQSLLSPLDTLRKGANIASAKILNQLINPNFGIPPQPELQAPPPQPLFPSISGALAPVAEALQAPGELARQELQRSIDVSLAEPPTVFERQFNQPIFQTQGGTTIVPSLGELVRSIGEFLPEAAFASSLPSQGLGQMAVERFGIQTPSIARTTQQAVQAGFGGFAGGLAKGEPEQAAIGAVAGPLLTFAGAGAGQTARELRDAAVKAGKAIGKEAPAIGKMLRGETGAITLADVPPVPETLQTLNMQMDALRGGRVNAVLVTPGSIPPKMPAGFQSIETPKGRFIFDPKKVSAEEIAQKTQQGTFGELLGFMEPKSPSATRTVVAYQNGVEAKTALVSPKNVQKQIREFERQFPGAKVVAGGERLARDVLEKRSLAPELDPTKLVAPNQPGELSSSALNFKLEKLNIPPEAKREVINVATQAEQEIFKQRRGVVNWGKTELEANKLLGDSAFSKKVLNSQPGQAFNASELEALGKANANLAVKVSQARSKWLENPLDKVADEDFKNLLKLQFKLQKTFQGGVAEAGRGLNILRKTKTPADTIDALRNKVIDSLNDEQIQNLAVKMAQAGDDPSKQFNVLSDFLESTWVDKIVEFSTAVKLYNPTTHIVNSISNFMSTMLNTAERFGASGVNLVESKLTGKPREVFTQAAVKQAAATGRAFPAAAKNFLKAIKDEAFQVGQQRSQEAVKLPAIKGTKGKIARISFRLLNAEDAFFRTLNSNGELAYSAANEGLKRGLKGKQLNQFIKDQIANPGEHFVEKANKVASEHLFQSELGPIAGKAQNLLNTKEWKPAKLFIPFFKTPVNITKFGGQRTPLGVFSPRNIKDFIKGNPEERSLAVARWGIGTALSSFATWYALAGNVTGDWPKDKGEAARWRREGIQPFAFKSGDKWVSYRRMAPFDSMFVMASKIADGWNKRGEVPTEQIVGEIALAATKKQLDTPYLQGVSDLLAVMLDDDDYKIERLASSQVTGNIPNIISAVARAKDPVFRAPSGVVERVQEAIPGLREKLPPRVDIFGRIQKKEGESFAERFLNPFTITTEKQTPADRTLSFYDFKPNALFGQTRGGIKIPNDIYAKHLMEGGKRFEKVATDVAKDNRQLMNYAGLASLNTEDLDPSSRLTGRKILKGIVGSLGDEHGDNALREYLPQAPDHIQIKFIKHQMKDLSLLQKIEQIFNLRSERLLTPRMVEYLDKTESKEVRTALEDISQKDIARKPKIIGF